MKLLVALCLTTLAVAINVGPNGMQAHFWADLTNPADSTPHGICVGRYGLPGTTGTGSPGAYQRTLWVYCNHNIGHQGQTFDGDYTDDVAAAHIHGPAGPNGVGPIAYTFTLGSGSNSWNPLFLGSTFAGGVQITSEASERALFGAGYYINIHTSGAGNGLIRGQLYPFGYVPANGWPAGFTPPAYVGYADEWQGNVTNPNYLNGLAFHVRRTTGLNFNFITTLSTYNAGTVAIDLCATSGGIACASPAATICSSCINAADNYNNGITDPGSVAMQNGAYFVKASVNTPTTTLVATLWDTSVSALPRFYGDDSANFWAVADKTLAKTSSTAVGYGLVYYNPITRELRAYIAHTVSGATAAHIHGPADASESAPSGIVCGLSATGTNKGFFSGTCVLGAAQEGWLYNGLTYFNVHSSTFTGGEIRGQIYNVTSMMPGRPTHAALINDLQAATATMATHNAGEGGVGFFNCPGASPFGACTGNIIYYGTSTTPSAAHVHGPAASSPGAPPSAGVVDTLCGAAPACGGDTNNAYYIMAPTLTFGSSTGNYESFYINVHTTAHGGGEIRGQIRMLSAPGPQRYSQDMDPANLYAIATGVVSGDNTMYGLCVATLNGGDNSMSYSCVHNCPGFTASHFHGPTPPPTGTPAAANFNGPPKWTITSSTLPSNNYALQGMIVGITATEWSYLVNGYYYFNVHTSTYAGGCATGTLYAAGTGQTGMIPTHTAVMDGMQVGFGPTPGSLPLHDPNLKAGGLGIALVTYNSGAGTVDTWQAWSGLGFAATAAHIHGPLASGGGVPIDSQANTYYPQAKSPLASLDTSSCTSTVACYTSNTALAGFTQGNLDGGVLYVNVHGPSPYANGVIRGAVTPVFPVTVTAVPSSTGGGSTGGTGSSTGTGGGSGSGAATLAASSLLVALLAAAAVFAQ